MKNSSLVLTFFAILFFSTLGQTETLSDKLNSTDSVKTVHNPVVINYNNSLENIISNTRFLYDDYSAMLTSPLRMQNDDLLKVCGIMATFGVLYYYDQELFNAIHRNRDNRVYKKVLEVGNFFEPSGLTRNTHPYYIAGFFVGYVFKQEWMQEASIQLLESMIFEGNTRVGIMHPLFGRSRPSKEQGPYFFQFQGDRSFPSGHTSNIFQLATILSHHIDQPLFTVAAFGIATTVGLQRIDHNSHWPSDVFMGAVYGITVSRAIIMLHEKRNLKISPNISMIEQTPVFGITYQFDRLQEK